MSFQEAQRTFGISLGILKRAYHEENGGNSRMMIVIDEDDYVTIIPSNATGTYTEIWRDWVDTE